MTDQTILMLGKLIEDAGYGRDAIHVAVAPVVAAERLAPGQHVGLIGADAAGRTDAPVGIVDPFLPAPVFKGDRFFLFLYPATITSLRHEWTHPAFKAQEAKALDGGEYTPRVAKIASEQWLRDFIATADCPDYEEVMGAVSRIANGEVVGWSGEYIHFDGLDAHGEIPPEFWHHAEIVLGRPIKGEKATGWSCSC